MPVRCAAALVGACILGLGPLQAEIFLGSGVKVGEVTDRTAIVLVRLTSTPGQNAQGLIPGCAGEARLRWGTSEKVEPAQETAWQAVDPAADWATRFRLEGLAPGKRHFYLVEFRESAQAPAQRSDVYSFRSAPSPEVRAEVRFHLTTCQDLEGPATYLAMAKQQPDFCVSAGDNVYYDGQCLARNVPQAWQAYQKMFGLPPLRDYYRHVSGYFMKDDHDYRFDDADPFMAGKWVGPARQDPGAVLTETRGRQRLDVAWLSHEEGIRVFSQVFPLGDRTYRTVRWGRGIQLWFLENRDFRSPNEMPDGPEKTIWGAAQKQWLLETLEASDADHRIIISPNPIVGPDRLLKGDNQANANGFWHEAQTFLDWLRERELRNVILMCGDRHWQYHSIDRRRGRATHEFSCGPTYDEHVQAVPPPYDGVDRPYAASRGGFLAVAYRPDRSLTVTFHSSGGEPLYQQVFRP